MLRLRTVVPTPEQLKIIATNKPGIEIIRGAAGSGKTTTALLKLKSLAAVFASRRQREQNDEPLEILVLTFNRTLKGYVQALADDQIITNHPMNLSVLTFGKWAWKALGRPEIINDDIKDQKIKNLASDISLPTDFLIEEVEYATTRFLPEDIDQYITVRRDGRGNVPRVERALRETIVNQVIKPYQAWLIDQSKDDWNTLAVRLAKTKLDTLYDVIIVDETQDFSANQIRAIVNQLAVGAYSLTFIVDTAQRIYARGFTWQETGLQIRPEQSKRLEVNYRNTTEIVQFVTPLLSGLTMDADGTLPDLTKCRINGIRPRIIIGKYSDQLNYVVNILNNIDLSNETVAFLHPKGWFSYLAAELSANNFDFVKITRESEWPDTDANIALCTLHSAKGLEFDHVIILGLNNDVLQHEEDSEDDKHMMLRRLLAMGILRAKKTVILGYKSDEAPYLIKYFDRSTYDLVQV